MDKVSMFPVRVFQFQSLSNINFILACVAAVSFPFPGEGDRTNERANRRAKDPPPGVLKKLGTNGEGVSEKGRGLGRKEITCSQSQTS